MKYYTTALCFLILTLTCKADDLAFTVKNTLKGAATGAIDLSISGGAAPFLVSWTGPNGYTAKTEDIDQLEAGSYTLFFTDTYCGTATATVIVKDDLTGMDEFTADHILVFPNPATAEVKIALPGSITNYQVRIGDLLGKEVRFLSSETATSSAILN